MSTIKQDDATARAYPLPNDSIIETRRLDAQHLVFSIRTGGLHRASFPNSSPAQVRDLGCGTGIWASQFAIDNPKSNVLGIDINPPLVDDAKINIRPPNCSFAVADIEQGWNFSSLKSDYIYMRMIMIAIKDWPGLLNKAFVNMNPGGQIEIFDGLMDIKADDGSTADNSAAIFWFQLSKEYLAKHHIAWDLSADIPQQLTDAGFEILQDNTLKMRLYPDSQDPESDRAWVATQYQKDIADIVHGMTKRMRIDLASRLSPEEWDTLESNARREILEESEQRGFHTTLYTSNFLSVLSPVKVYTY
ncbi:S-adenosyl-L-methionine-dependent methyltransferase [Penicillium citrinum]|uniref:S-adenosyl-L-methionine-dependent methyltransferase n=1 Tax=Penicillium citrinum TaxID=5077 RepID=A0A9W9TW26_PENCI|nr:S-adenosyl-L-methionine-dependent methyltransferase [Penicillium citrinum]KAJ5241614.1 S-adenosyl-L-methionine-dependent methyltransferase [Penicillium citrinum]